MKQLYKDLKWRTLFSYETAIKNRPRYFRKIVLSIIAIDLLCLGFYILKHLSWLTDTALLANGFSSFLLFYFCWWYCGVKENCFETKKHGINN